MQQTPSYRQLFWTFFRIGLTGFGGLAISAHIRKHVVDKLNWMDGKLFDSGLALCQVIPGAIVMQLVAFVGLKIKGVWGAVVCFFAFGLPAFLVMLLLSILYKHSHNISVVEHILSGLRIIIVAIVANAAFVFGKKNLSTINDWIIVLFSAGLFLTKLHPAIVLISAALLGILLTQKNTEEDNQFSMSKTLPFFSILLSLVLLCSLILYFIQKDYFTMATVMLRIDLFSFGGGLAAIPIMYHEFVDLFGWVNEKVFMDGVILGQVTPGSIIIAATFFGYLHLGIPGSILATICVFTPSFLILMGLIPFYDKLRLYPQFHKVINGILCSFVGLLIVVTFRFTIGIHWNLWNALVVILAFILLIKKTDVIWIILGGAVLSFFM